MHTMGKVGVWLVVVTALTASTLTSKLIQVRDSWTKKSVAAQGAYQALVPKISELQEQLTALEGERFRALDLWGNSSPPVQTAVQAQGVLTVEMGTGSGITEKKVIYGFEAQPDGSVVYRGDFTVTAAQNAQAQLQPNWRVRAEDVATWKSGMWRWRNQLPSAYQQNFDRQLLLLSEAEDAVSDRRQSVDVQTKLLAQAVEQLKLREAELVGGEQLSKDPAVDVEYREGLVAGVEQTEEARNQLLTQVDDLRRKLRAVQNNVDELQALNADLAKKLPQPMQAEVTKAK